MMLKRNPDKLIIEINKKSCNLYKAKQFILNNVFKNNSNQNGLNYNLLNFDTDFEIEKNSCVDAQIFLEENFEKFNKFYTDHSLFISQYYEGELIELHDMVSKVMDYTSNLLSKSLQGKENLLVVSSLMKSILLNCENLLSQACNLKENNPSPSLTEEIFCQPENQLNYNENILSEIELTDNKYYNDVRKTVNHICSQITFDNPMHTLGRLKELISLFNKKDVVVVGSSDNYINLAKYPKAEDLCWEFLHQAIITQTETQFSQNVDTTVVFATVISALLGKFPNRMEATMNILHRAYFTLLNSDINSSECDKDEEEQLDKIRGLCRLLAAILVARPPSGYEINHKLSPAVLWKLLASICNEKTSTSFFSQACMGFLEIGAETLSSVYGNQFDKMLVAMKNKFAETVNLSDRSLVLLIDDILINKTFIFQGYLDESIWHKRIHV